MIPVKSRLARLAAVAFAIAGAVSLTASSSAAATDGDLRAGVYTDAGALALGGGLLTRFDSYSRWYFNPNLEVVLADEDNAFALNGDFHYDFPTEGAMSVYLGTGLGVLVEDSDTNLGLNVLSGLASTRGEVRPFLQLKGIISDNNELALMGGVRF